MTTGKSQQIIGIIYVNLATIAWASNMVLGRLLKDSIGPITMSSVRFLVAGLIFAVVLRFRPAEDRKIGKDFFMLAAMAVTGVVLFSPLLYLGLRYTTAINSSMINSLAPLMTGIFAIWLLKQPLAGRQVSGALIALAGVMYLISGGSLAFWQSAQFNLGDLYVLFAATMWALYSVWGSKTMRNRSSVSATGLSIYIGLPALLVLALWELQHIPVVLNFKTVLSTIYLGVVPGAFGFYAWNAGVSRLGAGGAMVFYNTLPLYAALLSFLLLGEPAGLPHAVSGLLIIGGGVLAATAKREQPKPITQAPRDKIILEAE